MENKDNVVHVCFTPQFEDIYGVDNEELAVLLQHNKRTNELKLDFVTKDNKKSSIIIDKLKSVGLMMALEDVLEQH